MASSIVLDCATTLARTTNQQLFSATPSVTDPVDLTILYTTTGTSAIEPVSLSGFDIRNIFLPSPVLWDICIQNATWGKSFILDNGTSQRLLFQFHYQGSISVLPRP
jgi:hypothetical protein